MVFIGQINHANERRVRRPIPHRPIRSPLDRRRSASARIHPSIQPNRWPYVRAQHTHRIEDVEKLGLHRFSHMRRVWWHLAIVKLVSSDLFRLMHAVPFQVLDKCLREVLRLGHAEDGRLPKRLGLVVAIESLASVFGLPDIDDRLDTRFVLAKKKVNAGMI